MCNGPAIFSITNDEIRGMIAARLDSVSGARVATEWLAAAVDESARQRAAEWAKDMLMGLEQEERKLVYLRDHLLGGDLGESSHRMSMDDLRNLRCAFEPIDPPASVPSWVTHPPQMEKGLAYNLAQGPCDVKGRW